MSLSKPLKSLKIRLFSTSEILKNCCKIRKKTLTVWKFQTINVVLYSNLQIIFSQEFLLFHWLKVLPQNWIKPFALKYVRYSNSTPISVIQCKIGVVQTSDLLLFLIFSYPASRFKTFQNQSRTTVLLQNQSIFSLSICLTASDNAAVRYAVRHVADHLHIL